MKTVVVYHPEHSKNLDVFKTDEYVLVNVHDLSLGEAMVLVDKQVPVIIDPEALFINHAIIYLQVYGKTAWTLD